MMSRSGAAISLVQSAAWLSYTPATTTPHWGFGPLFEAQIARGLAEFFGRYDELRDAFWMAAVSEQVEGSITIDGAHAADTGAHLRWFIMSDALRGKGVGT